MLVVSRGISSDVAIASRTASSAILSNVVPLMESNRTPMTNCSLVLMPAALIVGELVGCWDGLNVGGSVDCRTRSRLPRLKCDKG